MSERPYPEGVAWDEAWRQRQRADECEAMLDFLLGMFQTCSPKMDGQHSYRFRYGWPWTHAKGPTIRDAVKAAMEEEAREKLACSCGHPGCTYDNRHGNQPKGEHDE